MASQDKTLTPELIKILKVFLLSSLGLVFVFSFFNTYRANNTEKDRSFFMADADRLYFQNVRAIQYDREVRRDAGMLLYRHSNRLQSDSIPSFYPLLILNPKSEEAYIYWELSNGEFPIEIIAQKGEKSVSLVFANGNNGDHLAFLRKVKPLIEEEYEFSLQIEKETFPLWQEPKEKEILKEIFEDYFRLLNQTN